ncbi:MAG TPA: sugar transferase [Myxococcales bacterium]|jgi:lipopolysaccharide/colanic/teichoic acid biosynthesis glycosyltransferase|nr:sugar transferase [Myxococcales bacterium]
MKRIFDLTLLLLAAPLILPVTGLLALAALIAQGRPVFFLQERTGLHGRIFLIWKLRSMSTEADVQARRPTRFGRWMRDRGLDEMPQLFNVFKGDMSLVGPRPLTPADCARLGAIHPDFKARLRLRPGLTGPAQVTLARGAALTARLDVRYAEEGTAVTDLAILLRTVWMHVVGKRRGAAALPR